MFLLRSVLFFCCFCLYFLFSFIKLHGYYEKSTLPVIVDLFLCITCSLLCTLRSQTWSLIFVCFTWWDVYNQNIVRDIQAWSTVLENTHFSILIVLSYLWMSYMRPLTQEHNASTNEAYVFFCPSLDIYIFSFMRTVSEICLICRDKTERH